MSLTPAPNVTLLDLPASWWGLLFQHVAATSDGVHSVAVLSSTCKMLHTLSEELDYIYQEVKQVSSSKPTEPFWRWLAKQKGHVPSLTVRVAPFIDAHVARSAELREAKEWKQPLRLLSALPDLQLKVRMPLVASPDHPFISQWLEKHGDLIGRLEVRYLEEHSALLSLEDLVEVVNLCDSVDLYCESPGICAPLAGLTNLTSLVLRLHDYTTDHVWDPLAALTGLSQLECHVVDDEAPSSLSALTGLTSLHLAWLEPKCGNADPYHFSFTSLQPLSALQQLEVLKLEENTCRATSLRGLAGLSSLQKMTVYCEELESLQGLSTSLTSLCIHGAWTLESLAGSEGGALLQELELLCPRVTSRQALATLSKLRVVSIHASVFGSRGSSSSNSLEVFQASSSCLQSLSFYDDCSLGSLQGVRELTVLDELTLSNCRGLTSLKPLGSLGSGVKKLHVDNCVGVVEEVLELPQVQPTADVRVAYSNVREVVLAGGVRLAAVVGK